MKISVTKESATKVKCDVLVIGFQTGRKLRGQAKAVDDSVGSHLSTVLDNGDVGDGIGSSLMLFPEKDKIGAGRILLACLGKKKPSIEALRRAASAAAKEGENFDARNVVMLAPDNTSLDMVKALVEGFILGSYSYDKFKSEKRNWAESLSIIVPGRFLKSAQKAAVEGKIIAESTCLARDLTNAPANELTVMALVNQAKRAARAGGFKIKVLASKDIAAEKMAGVQAVSKGSVQEPRFLVMEHYGAKGKPLVFVGKAVIFDTGGISLKPVADMNQMKYDMQGGAVVIATMLAISKLKLPIHAIGLVPIVENMPDGKSYRPGDVITYSNGKTVEVISTDAEGRLILADALLYADRFDPGAVVDIATLTGGVKFALAREAAGLLGNDRKLIAKVQKAGEKVHERLWPFPLWPEYKKLIKSETADMKNSGGKEGSTITASMLLNEFVNYPWAHIDIAGVGWLASPRNYLPKGGTGFGARLFVQLAKDHCKRK
jgi:leucyl aminopeptidase